MSPNDVERLVELLQLGFGVVCDQYGVYIAPKGLMTRSIEHK